MTFDDLGLDNLLYKVDSSIATVDSSDNVVSSSTSSASESSEVSSTDIASGEMTGNLVINKGFIRSKNYVAGSAGWTINDDGTAQFADITLIGGILKYGKTSFTDSTNLGYYFGSEGIYAGAASDTSKFKFTIADGTIDLIGTISSRSTATIASAINSSGNLITDLINVRLDTSAKSILSDFSFGATDYAGAVKSGSITWNSTTGAITGGSGVIVYRGGIVGANSGVATFTLDATTGNATFAGSLSAASGTLGTITAGTLSGVTMSIGSGNNIFKADANGIYLGNATFASAPFRVSMAGALVASSATITGSITITSGSGLANLSDVGGLALVDSADFSTQVSGAEKPANNATVGADWSVNLSNIPATLGTPSADGLYLSSAYLGYYKTGAWTSFIQNNGNFYFAGDAGSHIDWNITTPATLTIAGAIQATAGSVIATSYLSGNIGLSNTNIAAQGWTSTLVFSSTDYNTIAWASGTLTTAAGTAYSIDAGNTGNIAAVTYIYLDIAVSTTVLQTTTTAATAIGSGKVLIAVASPNTDTDSKATVQVFGGTGGQILLVDNIAANSASTNEFVANTANIADAIITNAKITSLDVSKLTAGTITSKTITLAVSDGTGDSYIAAGKTDFTNTDAGFILGIDDSDSNKAKFYIGNSDYYLNFDGLGLILKPQYSNLQLYETVVDAAGHGNYTTLSAAISAGKKKIFIRAGSYTETATISIGANVIIEGEDKDGVVITFQPSANDTLLELTNDDISQDNNILIKNITFTTDNTYTNKAISASGRYINIDNCVFYDWTDVALTTASGTFIIESVSYDRGWYVIEDCNFFDNEVQAINSAGQYLLIQNNKFRNNYTTATTRQHVSLDILGLNSVVKNNSFDNEVGGCIRVAGNWNNISDNIMYYCGASINDASAISNPYGLIFGQVIGNIISNNIIRYCPVGIWWGDDGDNVAFQNIITNNVINNCRRGGITLSYASYCRVVNNQLNSNTTDADNTYSEILIDNSDYVNISNNFVLGSSTSTTNPQYGIRLTSGSDSCIVIGNHAYNAETANISDGGAGNVVEHNLS